MNDPDVQHILKRQEENEIGDYANSESELLDERKIEQEVAEAENQRQQGDEDGPEVKHSYGIAGQIVRKSRRLKCEVHQGCALDDYKKPQQVNQRKVLV